MGAYDSASIADAVDNAAALLAQAAADVRVIDEPYYPSRTSSGSRAWPCFGPSCRG